MRKKERSAGRAEPSPTTASKAPKELSRTVAVLVPNLGSPFHTVTFRGINETLAAEGFDVLFHNVLPEDREDAGTLTTLRMNRPAGYIILRGGEGREMAHAHEILEEGVPVVCLGRIQGLEVNTVSIDDAAVMQTATDYVIERGHCRLCYLSGPPFLKASIYRQRGFEKSLTDHGIPSSEAMVVSGGGNPREAHLAALKALENAETRPTALLLFSDIFAGEVYRAARELALEIPTDVSVVGVDNLDHVTLLNPPLTSVDTFPEQAGRMAAELVVKAIHRRLGDAPVGHAIDHRLVERGSVRSR